MSANIPPERNQKVWLNAGITGKRVIPADKQEEIKSVLNDILLSIKIGMQQLLQDERNRAIFEPFGYGTEPGLSLLSSLAEGADRIAAHAALNQGYSLQCPLPMNRKQYAETFELGTPGQEDFDELLKKSERIFELEYNGENSSQAYADAARVMLNHSDILIAIWDGVPGKNIAGTYATMQIARHAHIPIICIPIQQPTECVYIDDTIRDTDWKKYLQTYLKQILIPRNTGQSSFLAPQANQVKWWWKYTPSLNQWTEKILLLNLKRTTPESANRGNNQEKTASEPNPWVQEKQVFSTMSGIFAKKYRNRIIWRDFLPLLAAMVLFVAVISPSVILAKILFFIQLLLIGAGLIQVKLEKKSGFQVRYIYNRVLAERCRLSALLWPIGFCNVRYRHSSYLADRGAYTETAWLYRIIARKIGLPNSTTMTREKMEQWLTLLKNDFILSQLEYHKKNCKKCAAITTRLRKLSMLFFAVGFLASLLKTLFSSIYQIPFGNDAMSQGFQYGMIALSMIFPAVASYCSAFSGNFGYERGFAASQGMKSELCNAQADIDAMLDKDSGNYVGKVSFSHKLCFTDAYYLAERIDACCTEEVSDWEDSVQNYIFRYN